MTKHHPQARSFQWEIFGPENENTVHPTLAMFDVDVPDGIACCQLPIHLRLVTKAGRSVEVGFDEALDFVRSTLPPQTRIEAFYPEKATADTPIPEKTAQDALSIADRMWRSWVIGERTISKTETMYAMKNAMHFPFDIMSPIGCVLIDKEGGFEIKPIVPDKENVERVARVFFETRCEYITTQTVVNESMAFRFDAKHGGDV